LKRHPYILEKERDYRQQVPDHNISGSGLGFHDIPHTVRRLDSEPVLVNPIDPAGIPVNTVNHVTEIYIPEFLILSLKILDINCQGKIKRFASSLHCVLGITGMITPEYFLEFFAIFSQWNNMGDVLVLEIRERFV
jgi:hypothetical protein